MSLFIIIGALPESLINFRGHLLKALVSGGHDVIAMASHADSQVVGELAHIGVGFRAYPIQRNGLNPFNDVKTFYLLRKTFDELKPDVVLSYNIKPCIWSGMALKGIPAPRFYALVTGLGFAFHGDGYTRRILKVIVSCLYRISLSRASQVIFQNPDNRDLFVSQQIIEKKKSALVNGSGVDLDWFALKPLPKEGCVFLTIGRLLGEKGFREYAQAAKIVRKKYPNAVFKLLGPIDPSPDRIPIEEVMEWATSGWIEYLGATSDVRPYIADCHVYVLPSYHEGLPRSVLEAMAMGRPILTTDVPGCRETVIPEVNGFLVPKSDAAALAERMIWFIERPGEWMAMGLRSRSIAESRFEVNAVNKELLKIMELL